MRRLIDPIELKRSIVVSNIIGDGKTLVELIDEQPDAQPTSPCALCIYSPPRPCTVCEDCPAKGRET